MIVQNLHTVLLIVTYLDFQIQHYLLHSSLNNFNQQVFQDKDILENNSTNGMLPMDKLAETEVNVGVMAGRSKNGQGSLINPKTCQGSTLG